MKLLKLFLLTILISFCFVECRYNKDSRITNTVIDSVYRYYDKGMWQFNRTGNYERSLTVADSIFKSNQSKDDANFIVYYSIYCWINRARSKYDISIKYADSAIAIYKRIGIDSETAKHYSILLLDKGFDEMKVGNYEEGYKCLFDAKKAIGIIKNICNDIWALDSYGLILFQQQEYELAKQSFIEQLNILNQCRKSADVESLFQKQNLLDNIALCYTKQNMLDSAKIFYFKALDTIEKMPLQNAKDTIATYARYNSAKGVVLGNLAKVFINTKPDTAILLYQQSIVCNLKNVVEIKDAQLSMFQLADILLKEQKNEQAFVILYQLKQSFDSIDNTKALLGYKKSLITYYRNTNQYQQALVIVEDYNHLKDSLQQKEIGINTTNVNKELQDREQQLQIQLLQKDKRIDNLYLGLIGGVLLLVTVLAFFAYRNYRKSKKQNAILVGLNNEISQQQRETEYALQELAISNKDKDRILGVVAHDLRNPIGAIVSLAHFVNESDENNPNADVIKMIETSGNQSLELINELLESQKGNKEKLNLTEVDIIELLKQTVNLLQHKLSEKKLTISFTVPKETILLQLDANKMERVLSNLITNAIKFSYENSSIKINLILNSENVMITVQDEGIGMAKEYQPYIFEKSANIGTPGTQGEKSYGLGLSICKQIIDAHNGKIWVESEEGKGSCFYIQLSKTL